MLMQVTKYNLNMQFSKPSPNIWNLPTGSTCISILTNMTIVLSTLQSQPNYWYLDMIRCALLMALTCLGNVFLQRMSWKKSPSFAWGWADNRSILTWSREEVWRYSCAIHMPCSVIYTARDKCFTCIIHWCWHEVRSRIGCIYKLLGLWELDQRLFQVVQWPFYKNFLFLVKVQQVIPQWLLQIRTFGCRNLNTKTFKHTFQVYFSAFLVHLEFSEMCWRLIHATFHISGKNAIAYS